MYAAQGRSETPEPPWVKKFVVGLYYGAAYHDAAFVGHGGGTVSGSETPFSVDQDRDIIR